MPKFAKIALPLPQFEHFTYRVPDVMADSLSPGMLVSAPFRDQAATGVVLGLAAESDVAAGQVKEISAIGDPELRIGPEILAMVEYVCQQYLASPGMVIKSLLPPGTLIRNKMYLYPGPGEISSKYDSSTIKLWEQIGAHPGRLTIADGARQGGVSRQQIEQLIAEGAISLSPFKARRTQTLRGKERWIRTAVDEVPSEIKLTPPARKLFELLLGNKKGMDAAQLVKLGFSPAIQAGLVKKGVAQYFFLDRGLREIGEMKSLPSEDGIVLNLWQQAATEKIQGSLNRGGYQGYLLYGVTSSGKTQVYLEAARHALTQGKSVLALVPEISLTPQIIARFKRFLGIEPLVWHSHLSATERLTVYKAANSGRARLIIGARSAIFAPLAKLGLIAVDEEQDHSYKQDDPSPRYNARDLALYRGQSSGAVVVLGSATPSMESYYQAKTGRLELLTLPQRVSGKEAPRVEIISTAYKPQPGKKEPPIFPRGFRPISEKLYQELYIRLKKKEQAILLLNRRGYSSAVVCFECGWLGKCPDCEIGWTYHKTSDKMICHYCGREQKGPTTCVRCGSAKLSFRSAGTQRLEETLDKILPGVKTVRLDTDVITKKWESRDILDDFGRGKYQALLGTQMVAKGHHFPRVGFVGVISADIGLSLPDFRASERVLQLLTQAAGRAGRSTKKNEAGIVMVQTFSADNPIFEYLKSSNYLGFIEKEMEIRQALGYPPFKRLILLVVSWPNADRAREAASVLRDELCRQLADKSVEVLGPVESPIFKIGKMNRYQILLKVPQGYQPKELMGPINDFTVKFKGGSLKVDVDPVSFM